MNNLKNLLQTEDFISRHISLNENEIQEILKYFNEESLESFTENTLPNSIKFKDELKIGQSFTENEALAELKKVAQKNKCYRSYIGQGYYGTIVPNVILRNVLENPGWYTAYTPYQAEISQGRLEMLLNFQQMIMDLTAMPIANASLLDEATAAAEAMTLAKRASKHKSNIFAVDKDVHTQTKDVIRTRAEFFGFEVKEISLEEEISNDVFAVLVQYPCTKGTLHSLSDIAEKVHSNGGLLIAATDLLASALIKPAGECGADIVIGSAQRFGVPMGFGGPHAAFLACKEGLQRSMPGRIIGVSKDSKGKQALRMAMQTREQHIRREKATSNICTAQALLANMAASYAIYHGKEGIETIAKRVNYFTGLLAKALANKNIKTNTSFFDTLTFDFDQNILNRAEELQINLRVQDNKISISLDETVTLDDLKDIAKVILNEEVEFVDFIDGISENLKRTTGYLTHSVFKKYRSEHAMLRYLKKLENRDYSLTHGMIPLGSCTMKLNATAEMIPVTWNEFANLHPFIPTSQAEGYQEMITELEKWLADVTGYDAVSMQPNSGAQGEYAGLLTIRKYQIANNQGYRDVCLIPASAHGTNPATASMMGLKVVVVKTDDKGNIDMEDLKNKVAEHSEKLSALMITYPSTHGVYEETVKEICDLIHENGGQVYLDGANMNAQVGISKPGLIGSDVSHLNLHKTFAIPHGGGGPGMGPIGVKSHLAPYLPNHSVVALSDSKTGAVAAAQYGSASILPISYMYMKLLGSKGLKKSTQVALLSANYIAKRLEGAYNVLYTGKNGRVAHECIVDIRPIKAQTGITEEDIAKRLMDYGFHAPTMSFPVAGTLMIEPTESEPKEELDRFIDAMLSIREEIREVEKGNISAEDSPLHHAPHTQEDLIGQWDRKYSREVAAFPTRYQKEQKFWPAVNRVDNVYGDRNFVCSCPATSEYEE